MTARLEVFKCTKCGNIVEVLHGGACVPSCCGQPMKAEVANTVDASKEAQRLRNDQDLALGLA